jgi:hypothetical protein
MESTNMAFVGHRAALAKQAQSPGYAAELSHDMYLGP